MSLEELQIHIKAYYAGTGYNSQDLIKWLDSEPHNGCDRSLDGTMVVYEKGELLIIVSCCGVSFARKLQ
jgi:hypothetical protein